MVNESAHMNAHGGSRLRQAIAARGSTARGAHATILNDSRFAVALTWMFYQMPPMLEQPGAIANDRDILRFNVVSA